MASDVKLNAFNVLWISLHGLELSVPQTSLYRLITL